MGSLPCLLSASLVETSLFSFFTQLGKSGTVEIKSIPEFATPHQQEGSLNWSLLAVDRYNEQAENNAAV